MNDPDVRFTLSLRAQLEEELSKCLNPDGTRRFTFWSGAIRPTRRLRNERTAPVVLSYNGIEKDNE